MFMSSKFFDIYTFHTSSGIYEIRIRAVGAAALTLVRKCIHRVGLFYNFLFLEPVRYYIF